MPSLGQALGDVFGGAHRWHFELRRTSAEMPILSITASMWVPERPCGLKLIDFAAKSVALSAAVVEMSGLGAPLR